jgi:hypothetical protein
MTSTSKSNQRWALAPTMSDQLGTWYHITDVLCKNRCVHILALRYSGLEKLVTSWRILCVFICLECECAWMSPDACRHCLRLKPHCIRCSHFKVDDVSALEAASAHCWRQRYSVAASATYATAWIEFSVALSQGFYNTEHYIKFLIRKPPFRSWLSDGSKVDIRWTIISSFNPKLTQKPWCWWENICHLKKICSY